MQKAFNAVSIQDGGIVYEICPIKADDVSAVAELYRSVAITDCNYRERFEQGGSAAFDKIGGMFLILQEEALFRIVHDPKELFLVARGEDGSIAGCIWYSFNHQNFRIVSQVKWNGNSDLTDCFRQWRDTDTLVYGREIIVRPGTGHLALYLFEVIQKYLYCCGYRVSFGEVYRLRNYTDFNGTTKLDMLNQPSYHTLCHTGGIEAGIIPKRWHTIGKYSICLDAIFFYWQFENSLPVLQDYLKRKITR